MSEPILPWPRPRFSPGGAAARFFLFCFSPGPLRDDVPLSAGRFGLPSDAALQGVEVRALPREADPRWFDGFRSGALRGVAQAALGDLTALDAATRVTVVLISREDPPDLAHLQAGWASAQWLVARGATVVLDAQAQRFWRGEDVAAWPAGRPFALSAELNLVVEAEPTSPTATIHTRGLVKFGRPDLVVYEVPAARWDAVGALVRGFALELASGVQFKPGDVVPIEHGQARFRADPATAALYLDNEALVIEAA